MPPRRIVRRPRTLAVIAALASMVLVGTVLTGCDDDPVSTVISARNGDTVKVEMTDNKFSIDELTVPVGAEITFVFHNSGAVGHEAVIGDQHMQDEHTSNGAHDMDPASTVEVGRDRTERLTYTFASAGNLIVGCHQPGHYESGMKFVVKVV